MSVLQAAKKVRKILADPTVVRFVGVRLSDEALLAFRDELSRHFPEAPPERLLSSVAYLAYEELGLEALRCAVWRLAVNRATLRHGPIPPWRGQVSQEKVDGIVEDVTMEKADSRTILGLGVRVLTGTAVGIVARKRLSHTALYPISLRLGFAKRGPSRIAHRLELLGLWCRIDLMPSEGNGHALRFSAISASSTQRAKNSKLIRARLRELARPKPIWRCPKGYPAEDVPCWRCRWGRDVCPVAVRETSVNL